MKTNEMIKKTFLFLVFVAFKFSVYSQTLDLSENYSILQSKGAVPALLNQDFHAIASKELSDEFFPKDKLKEEYIKFTEYGFNKLLNTGNLLFGDPLTEYVSKIGERLLKNVPEIKNDITFFVLKANYTNALMMEPGVIVVTTGLLAQIENEAQLAFVLAHEIAHYREKHLQKSFSRRKAEGVLSNPSFLDLVGQSKEDEFEADLKGIELYHDAGYAKNQIDITFLMLMYSYLPFNEVEIDVSFFGNDEIYIPESYFIEKSSPIVAFEEYNDITSTHPNIKERKQRVATEVDNFSNWQNNHFFYDKKEFEYIQDLARFETIRITFLRGNYVDALYEVFLLEKKYPKNQFLKEMKANIWYELHKIYLTGARRSFMKNINKAEGAISKLYYFLNKLDKNEMGLLATRMIEDAYLLYPENTMLQNIRSGNQEVLAHNRSIDFKTLEKISFKDALTLSETEKDQPIEAEETEESATASKYEKIAQMQQQNSSSKSIRPLVDENFAYYLLYDLVNNEDYSDAYHAAYKRIIESKTQPQANSIARGKADKGDLLLVFSDHYVALKGKLDASLSIAFRDHFHIQMNKREEKGEVINLGYKLSSNQGVTEYNTASLLTEYLKFATGYGNKSLKSFYPYQNEVDALLSKYNNPTLLFFNGDHRVEFKELRGSFLAFDVENQEEEQFNYKVKGKVTTGAVSNLIFRLFQNI